MCIYLLVVSDGFGIKHYVNKYISPFSVDAESQKL